MDMKRRFPVVLAAQARKQLDELAGEVDLSVSDLIRIAVNRLLADQGALTLPRVRRDQSQAA